MDHALQTSFVYQLSPYTNTVLPSFSDAIGLVDYLLYVAYRRVVSDIHVQFQEHDVAIRLRIDGLLQPVLHMSRQQGVAVLARLKILMGLDSTQVQMPQDGAMRLQVAGSMVDVRGSFFPSLYGEKGVVRFLNGSQDLVYLHSLPFDAPTLQALYAITRQEQGLFLVTGPTGAGKTTTLYALLQAVDCAARNVVTLENPIEYRIPGITQTQIDPSRGLTFAQGVRSLLRQDPDVALIGELRDADTVHSAIEAALTGHLVFSSLHTPRAVDAPVRLSEMGVESYLIAHALKGVLAQRLVQKLCVDCMVMRPLSQRERAWAAAHRLVLSHTGISAGCEQCSGLGFAGQTLIAELWLPTEKALQDVAGAVREAQQMGMRTLLESGAALVEQGKVSIHELMHKNT